MRFGLWVEPEMVNPDSTLYAEHPDWAVGQPARRPRRWRNQLVLDVLQPDVADFVTGVVDRVLAENPGISYLKWDANRPLTDPGSPRWAPTGRPTTGSTRPGPPGASWRRWPSATPSRP